MSDLDKRASEIPETGPMRRELNDRSPRHQGPVPGWSPPPRHHGQRGRDRHETRRHLVMDGPGEIKALFLHAQVARRVAR